MELRARTEKLADPQAPTAMPPVTKATHLLVELEHDVQTHRFLRGLMCFLAFLIYILSSFQITNYAGVIVLHVLMLLLTLAAEVCLYFIYRIKARFSGFTNPAASREKGQPSQVSVLHSPYMWRMVGEMVLWIIQAPPGLSSGSAMNVLDSFIVLRAYVFVLYLSQLSSQQVFKRAIATLCGFRFDSGFLVRYSFVYHSASPFTIIGFVGMWLCLGLMYSKAEDKGFGESIYFCFSTATFVGYGDFSPRSFTGRIAAFFSFCLGGLVLAWCVAIAYKVTKLSAPERNMHNLFRTNKLCERVPGEAARVIQRAWKLYRAKKEQHNVVSIQFNAFWLSAQAVSFRKLRREFAAAEISFLRSTFSFEDAIGSLSAASSRATSPSATPRAGDGLTPRSGQSPRRPFALFQRVKAKETPRESTAVSSGTATNATNSVNHSFNGPAREVDAGVRDVQQRMKRMEDSLDELIRRTQRIAAMPIAHSPTEVAS